MSTGKKIVEVASRKLGQAYNLGAVVPLNNPHWSGPWDCSELCSWAVFQVSGILYGTKNNNYTVRNTGNPATADAYTGYWDHDSKSLGERISVAEASSIPGAMILRPPAGGRGHIAISDGNGGTVEARGLIWGVVKYTIADRDWETGILVPGIHYETENENINEYLRPTGLLKMTTPYTTGPDVKKVQTRLLLFGYNPGPVDGVYGPKTEAAIIAFQSNQGLTVDGVVGRQTLNALFSDRMEEPIIIDEDISTEQWSCSEGWKTTGYYTPHESDFPYVRVRKINVGGSSFKFPDRFLDVVRMEGWGKTRDGWYLGYYSRKYHRDTEPKDSRGRKLEEGVVAVDPHLIQNGTKIKIHGVPAVNGRIFTAKDVGGAISDKHIDIYCGEGNIGRLKTIAVTTDNAEVCVL